MANIQSRLWKSAQLVSQSTYFPAMVSAAAAFYGKEYTPHMLQKVAATPAIVDALPLEVDSTIDEAILNLMTASEASGSAVDQAILNAVGTYTAPVKPV